MLALSREWVYTGLQIVAIIVVTAILAVVFGKLLRRTVTGLVKRSAFVAEPGGRYTARAHTLAGVTVSLMQVALWTVAVFLILDKLKVNVAPLLAGAGIVGIAVGFGAQSLVKDFVSGFFLLAEDQFGVGDVITVTDVTGTVEEVNLRVTRLRAQDGTVWFVPNGEIRKVGNAARDWSRALVDVFIPAGVDVQAALTAIADEVKGVREESAWTEAVLDAPEVLGVESIGVDGVTVRVAARTDPPRRAEVARELRGRIGARLAREGLATKPPPTGAVSE
ncbi:MAG: mechanosensitive ion channel family protein [Acidimicrobiales bacterium]